MQSAQRYQAQIEGLKALVNMVEVDEETFRLLLRSRDNPTIVSGTTGVLWFRKHCYLTSYDGFVFLLKSPAALDFAEDAPGALYVAANTISIPFL